MQAMPLLLLAVYASSYLDRHIFSLLLEPIRLDLNLTDLEAGLVSGLAFSIVYAVGLIPAGYLAARGNRRNLVALSALLWGTMTAACGLATSFWQLMSARAAMALSEAGAVPGSHSLLSDGAIEQNRLKAFGRFMTGPSIGGVLAVVIGGMIGQAYGWRSAMIVAGVLGSLPGLLLFLAREPVRAYWPETKDTETGSLPEPSRFRDVARTILGNPAAWLATVAEATNQIVVAGAVVWYPAFLMRVHGFSPTQTAGLITVASLLAISGTLLSSWLIQRLSWRRQAWLAWGPAVLIAVTKPFSAVFLLSDQPIAFLAAFLVPAAFSLSTYAPTISLIHSAVTPGQRPLASALLLSLATIIGMGIGPALVGWASSLAGSGDGASLRFSLLGLQAVGLVACTLYWFAGHRLDAHRPATGLTPAATASSPNSRR